MLTLVDHADALTSINADQDLAVARDVTGMFNSGGQRVAHAVHTELPGIIDLHAHNSGLLTSHWYDGIDPSSSFRAKPFADVPAEQIEKVVDWALHAPGEEPPLDRLVGASQRLVRGASRQTVTRNAAREGVLWARYAQPEACSFCRALSIRGQGKDDRKYLYDSDKTAEFRKSDGEAYHTLCKCEPVAVRGGLVWTPPEYTADWKNQYDTAAKKTDGGGKYFQRVVQQMRVNENAAVAKKAADEAEAAAAEAAAPDPVRVAARETLDAATGFREIVQAAADLLPDTRISVGDEALLRISDAGSPNLWDQKAPAVQENLRAMVQAADDVLTKYPGLELDSLQTGTDFNGDNPYATTGSTLNAHRVKFNRAWLVNPASLESSWETGIETGFHFPGSDNPVYDIMVHEMGHVIQRNAEDVGVEITDDDISRALMVHFFSEGPVDDTEGESDLEKYRNWLAANLSGYSTYATAALPGREHGPNVYSRSLVTPERVPINGREALAEAFADVEVNGDDASETSIVLHALLIDAYNRSTEEVDDGLAAAV